MSRCWCVSSSKDVETGGCKHAAFVWNIKCKASKSGFFPHYKASSKKSALLVLKRGVTQYAMRCDSVAVRDEVTAECWTWLTKSHSLEMAEAHFLFDSGTFSLLGHQIPGKIFSGFDWHLRISGKLGYLAAERAKSARQNWKTGILKEYPAEDRSCWSSLSRSCIVTCCECKAVPSQDHHRLPVIGFCTSVPDEAGFTCDGHLTLLDQHSCADVRPPGVFPSRHRRFSVSLVLGITDHRASCCLAVTGRQWLWLLAQQFSTTRGWTTTDKTVSTVRFMMVLYHILTLLLEHFWIENV